MTESILLYDTLLDILSEGDGTRCRPEKLSVEIRKINYVNIINEIKDCQSNNTDSYDKLKKSIKEYPHIDDDALLKFLISLSKMLSIDEKTTINLWDKYYKERYYITLPKDVQSIKSRLKFDFSSFELLDKIRYFFSSNDHASGSPFMSYFASN